MSASTSVSVAPPSFGAQLLLLKQKGQVEATLNLLLLQRGDAMPNMIAFGVLSQQEQVEYTRWLLSNVQETSVWDATLRLFIASLFQHSPTCFYFDDLSFHAAKYGYFYRLADDDKKAQFVSAVLVLLKQDTHAGVVLNKLLKRDDDDDQALLRDLRVFVATLPVDEQHQYRSLIEHAVERPCVVLARLVMSRLSTASQPVRRFTMILYGPSSAGKSTFTNEFFGFTKADPHWRAESGGLDQCTTFSGNDNGASASAADDYVPDLTLNETHVTVDVDGVPFEMTVIDPPGLTRDHRQIGQLEFAIQDRIQRGNREPDVPTVDAIVAFVPDRVNAAVELAHLTAFAFWVPVVPALSKHIQATDVRVQEWVDLNKHLKSPITHVAPVRFLSRSMPLHGGAVIAAYGLDELSDSIVREVMQRQTKLRAQPNFDEHVQHCRKKRAMKVAGIIVAFSGLGASTGGIPVPIVDAMALAPLIYGMCAAIARVYFMKLPPNAMRQLMWQMAKKKSTVAITVLKLIGMGGVDIALSILKLIPVINIVATAADVTLNGLLMVNVGLVFRNALEVLYSRKITAASVVQFMDAVKQVQENTTADLQSALQRLKAEANGEDMQNASDDNDAPNRQ